MAGIMGSINGGWRGGRSFGAAMVGLALTLAATTLGGCSSVSKEQYDALGQENEQLRQQVNQQQTAGKQTEQEVARLQAENAKLMAAVAAPPANTGFQGDNGGGGGGGSRPQRDTMNDSGRTVGTINFGPGSVTVDKASAPKLDSIASALKGKYSGMEVRVEGHADGAKPTKGKYKSNEELSEARAEAVKRYLVQKGVSSSRITTVGRGSTTSKVSRDGRRADVIVIGAN